MENEQPTEWSAEIAELYGREARQLWAMFYAQCSDAENAWDAVQEAFLRLQKQVGEPIRDKRAWLLHVGRNWLRDVARRKSSSVRSGDHLDRLAHPDSEPSHRLLDEETRAAVRTALSELRVDDRTVLVLRYALGWSSNRMADVLESSASAVDMRLSRARRRLAEVLEEMGLRNDEQAE